MYIKRGVRCVRPASYITKPQQKRSTSTCGRRLLDAVASPYCYRSAPRRQQPARPEAPAACGHPPSRRSPRRHLRIFTATETSTSSMEGSRASSVAGRAETTCFSYATNYSITESPPRAAVGAAPFNIDQSSPLPPAYHRSANYYDATSASSLSLVVPLSFPG